MLVFIVRLTVLSSGYAANPRVRTEGGDVIGTRGTTLNGRSYNAFFAIPYADKPIGSARFEEAREAPPWTVPVDGRSPPPVCPQYDKRGKPFGQEDCLYLNVYTPANLTDNGYPVPVIVLIHGGAFFFFSGNSYGPRYLLDKDVILVTFNYRLGIFGFLSTEDHTVPGNNGLKDQTLALGWIQRNIANFGGDPGAVTLIGFSAGAVSVHYHYFSVLSRGLFHRAYITGGTSFNVWAVQKNGLQKAKEVARSVRCPTDPVPLMVHCLRKAPVDKLALSTLLFHKFLNTPVSPWGPVLDKNWSSNPFLLEYPIQSLLANRHYNVPLVISESPNSGLYPVAEFIDNEDTVQRLNDNWNELGPYFLDTIDTVPPELQSRTLEYIRSFYIGKKYLSQNLPGLVKMATDRLFQSDIGRVVSLHALVNPRIFFIMFHYRGAKSSSDSLSGTKKNWGVSHIDDMYYLMNTPSADQPVEKDETGIKMIARMTEMVYNFARTGRPVFLKDVRWPPVRGIRSSIRYLRIDSPDEAEMDSSTDLGNAKFWASLPLNEPWAGRVLF